MYMIQIVKKIWQKINWWAGLVLLIGLFAFVIKFHIAYPIEWIGYLGDEPAYAEMADSIVHGRGLEVDYISWYFLKYDRKISRPEDHWPPLYSFFIVPFFLLFGKTAFAAKLPSLIISCFFLPLTGCFLGKRLSGSKFVGVAAGLNLLFYPIFFQHSLRCLSDITYAFMVCLTVLFTIKGLENGGYFYLMGICMALAYYAKGSGLVLIPAYVLFYLICRTEQDWRADRQFLIGIGLCFLTLLPWFIRNTIHFHNPIFSTQQFCAGYIGYIGWEEGTYKLYWGEDLPSFFDKLKWGFQFVYDTTWRFLKQYLWWTFIDLKRTTGDFNAKDYYTYFTGIPAAIALSITLIASLYQTQVNLARRIILQLCKRQKRITPHTMSLLSAVRLIHRGLWRILKPWYNRQLHIVTLVGFFLFGFLSLCWMPISRMAFPISALVIIVGWASYYTFLRGLCELMRIRYSKFVILGLMVVLLTTITIHSSVEIERDYQNGRYPYHDEARKWIKAARWIGENLPGSVTMAIHSPEPWHICFYSGEKSVMTPLASLEEIIEVAKYYNVTHIISGTRRAALEPWFKGYIPGLKCIYDKGPKIFKIEYEKIPSFHPVQLVNKKTIALWLCDEGGGKKLKDSSGNGHDGILEGRASWVEGKFGKALKLNGSPDRVVVPGSASLTGSDAMTIELWIKAPKRESYQIPIAKGVKGPGHWEIYLHAGDGTLSTYIPDLGDFTGTYSVTDDQWHHCAMVWDGSSIRLYVDGREVNKWTGLENKKILNDYQPLYIGSLAEGKYWYTGLIDEVRISSMALSPEQFGYHWSLATDTKSLVKHQGK